MTLRPCAADAYMLFKVRVFHLGNLICLHFRVERWNCDEIISMSCQDLCLVVEGEQAVWLVGLQV